MTPEPQNRHALTDRNLNKQIAAWEIVSVMMSGLIAAWAVHAFAGKGSWVGAIPITLAMTLIIVSQRERGESLQELGFRLDNFWAATQLLLVPTVLAVVLFFVANWVLDGPGLALRPFRLRLLSVPLWALFQQFVLQAFVNRRAQIVFGRNLRSVLLVGLVFSLLHLPSPLLVLLGFVGGSFWAYVYQRHPNLFALAISHTIISVTLSLTMLPRVTYLLRIGFKYFG
ncbi:MAG TPA: CPBP family glutamic-type intramembrane protease [Pyrinomonadaceae bacterium]|nr:CPBP family glutamic-type intramembrane protease [Pyrinomonadaceae bacterium]